MTPGPILVATDFSKHGDDAIRHADGWARRVGAPLVACHVVPNLVGLHPLLPQLGTEDVLAVPRLHERLREALATRIKEITGRVRKEYEVDLEQGSAGAQILRCAARHKASLIVLGATGQGPFDRALLGSSAEHVVRHSKVPVLIARRATSGAVMAAVDMTQDTDLIVATAVTEARRREAPLIVMHSLDVEHPSLFSLEPAIAPSAADLAALREKCSQRLCEALTRCEAQNGRPLVADGPAAQSVTRIAQEHGVDLIVLGTHSQAEQPGGFVGSVAQALVRRAPCSVLIVHLPL